MTEQELIRKQDERGNTGFYLMKVGMFYHAYESGAFALARAMNYRVKRKLRKGGREVSVAGFPVDSLKKVMERMQAQGASFSRAGDGDHLFLFSGVDGAFDESLVDDPVLPGGTTRHPPEIRDDLEKLKEQILSFDLGSSTPMDAMNFVDSLQKHIKKGLSDKCVVA